MAELWNFLTEDWTGFVINVYFGVALLPTLFDRQKPPLSTSISTGIGLILLGIGGSYRALATSIVVVVLGLVWLYIGLQRWRQHTTRGARQ